MAEFMIIYRFLSTFTRYLFEFDKSLLKGVHFLPESTRFSPVFLNVSKRDGFRLRILLPRNNSSPCVKPENRQKKNMVLSEDSTNGRLFCSLLFAIVMMNLTLTERFLT